MTDSNDKGILGGIAALITAIAALVGLFWGPELTERFFFPTFTPSPTLSPIAINSTATAIDTLVPVNSPNVSGLESTSPAIPPSLTLMPTPVVDCKSWQAYSDGSLNAPSQDDCANDIVFSDIGVVGWSADKVTFSVSNSQRGIYGMVLPLGPVPQIKRRTTHTVRLNIKDLTAGRFIVAFSPDPRPDVQGAYAIVINPDASQLITKYFFYEADGIPDYSIFQERPYINPIQGVDYTVKFEISYPNLSIEVNGGNFKPKAQQISFTSVGYIFVGYQRISSETARTRITAEVSLP